MKHAPHIEALRRFALEDLEDRGLEDDDLEGMQVESLVGDERLLGYKLTVSLLSGQALAYELSVTEEGAALVSKSEGGVS